MINRPYKVGIAPSRPVHGAVDKSLRGRVAPSSACVVEDGGDVVGECEVGWDAYILFFAEAMGKVLEAVRPV